MIKIENVKKIFDKNIVLKNVNLSIKKGEIQALLGANGAGKSTLINIISGFLKQDDGNFFIDDHLISSKDYSYRTNTGYVFETPLYIENFSAKKYISFVGDLQRIPKKTLIKRVNELLYFFDLPIGNSPIESYSKGMKSKTSLAAALVNNPSYLILDEPFDGLDFLSVQKVSRLLKDMASKGATILVTSHQYDIISEISNRFALLKDGEVLFNSTLAELEDRANSYNVGKEKVKLYLEYLMNKGEDKENLSWIKPE